MQIRLFSTLLLICSLLGNSLLSAQPIERPKERTVVLEKLFIEACREKLLGNIEEAIQLYKDVLQKDDTNAASNYELARLYHQQKNLSKALIRAERAVELQPNNLLYNKLYARLLEREGNYRKAAELYAKLTSNYPDMEVLYTEWAYYLTKAGRADAAIKVYNTLEKRVGIKESISMRKYKLYNKLGKDRKAIQELEQLVKTYPKDPEYLIRLANYYTTIQDFTQSKIYYQKALELDPNNPTANLAMVEFFLQNGDTTRYLNALLNTFEDPSQEVTLKIKTLNDLMQGIQKGELNPSYHDNVYRLSERLIQAHPNNSKVHALRGNVLFQQQRYSAAAKQYQMAVRTISNDLNLWCCLLESLHRARRDTHFQKYAKEFIDLYPSQAYSYYYHGVALYQQGQYSQAIKDLKQSIDIGFNNMIIQGNALRYLAQIYEQKKDITQAEKAYNEAILMQPEDAEIIHAYARSLVRRKVDLEKATSLLDGICTEHPNNPYFKNTAAWLAYQKNDYAQAEQLLKTLLQSSPNQVEALERYGDVLFRTERKDLAVTYWQKALDKGASSPLLPKKIATRQLYE